MKKVVFFLALIFLFSNRMMGQKDLSLNEMLLSSFNLYIENHKEYVKQGASASDTCHYYACKDGLPSNFPFEKLSDITFFSLQNINGLPSFLKKEIKKGIGVLFAETELNGNQLVVRININNVKLAAKNHLRITLSDWNVFIYEYSCIEEKWETIKIKRGGV